MNTTASTVKLFYGDRGIVVAHTRSRQLTSSVACWSFFVEVRARRAYRNDTNEDKNIGS